MGSTCRTKELQLTDCQAQHCRAKREPRTDYIVAFVRPGRAGGRAFDKIARSAKIGEVQGGSIRGSLNGLRRDNARKPEVRVAQ